MSVVISRVPLKSQNLRTQLGQKLLNFTPSHLRHSPAYKKNLDSPLIWETGVSLLSFQRGWDEES